MVRWKGYEQKSGRGAGLQILLLISTDKKRGNAVVVPKALTTTSKAHAKYCKTVKRARAKVGRYNRKSSVSKPSINSVSIINARREEKRV